jgi:hypothetical protein
MNAALPPHAHQAAVRVDLARLALSSFQLGPALSDEAAWLDALHTALPMPLREAWQRWLDDPPPADHGLCRLASRHGLTRVEMVALALCCAVELDPTVARVVHGLQSPVAGARPSVGLVVRAAMLLDDTDACEAAAHLRCLHSGVARQLGLIEFVGDHGVLIERSLRTAPALALTLAGHETGWPEIEQPHTEAFPLGQGIEQQLHALAMALPDQAHLVLRCAWPAEAWSAVDLVARSLGLEPVLLTAPLPPGVGTWLSLTRRLPVLSWELAPGELRVVGPIPGHDGPVVLLTGMDGSVQVAHAQTVSWTLPTPAATERTELWRLQGLDEGLARDLGAQQRLSAARIRELALAARQVASLQGRSVVQAGDVSTAARSGAALQLGAQASLMPDEVGDEALVLPPALRESLDQLHARCLQRDGLGQDLGPALRTRYRPGVRALFTGASGTGKTLAAGWIASRLGLPMYRVDLSAVVSKYIGETEKNLAQLFARADSAELVLLFDEADALFGKRTDIKDSNDRFANQQTNYLLQRIESFEGIAILTSNSRGRLDAAFTRRLDAVIEFPAPSPQERRALWLAHLGPGHGLNEGELNRVAALCDLAGGHIRNCALMAASLERPIGYAALRQAILAEHAKLGRMPPGGL